MGSNGVAPDGEGQLRVALAIFDFPMLSVGFQRAIDAEPDMRVVQVVEDRGALRDRIAHSDADVVIVECTPYADGACTAFAAIEDVKATKPSLKIVALECRCTSEQFSLALKAGADGFLNREARPNDVVTAVRCVSAGQTYVCPAIVTRMVNTYVLRTTQTALEDPYDHLSEREREVLLLAAVGHTNREIAQTLHLSEQTIHNYRANIMEKLGFHDRVELLKYALRRGVLTVADL
ncbi:MAG TPA: response regulator transcription factor [Candidatus Dormibacteraeota bacterium]|nr:response regulator transcription factor [Candidatus Dormibacteraeota bacterium]